jgi:hypothetical protein
MMPGTAAAEVARAANLHSCRAAATWSSSWKAPFPTSSCGGVQDANRCQLALNSGWLPSYIADERLANVDMVLLNSHADAMMCQQHQCGVAHVSNAGSG